MPAPSLKTMAHKAGKPLDDVERYWQEAKKAARKQGIFKRDGEDQYYRYLMGIVKRRLGGESANAIHLSRIEARLRSRAD